VFSTDGAIIGEIAGFGIIFLFYKLRDHHRSRLRIRAPVKDKMLRPAGESLRLQIEDLDVDLIFFMVFFAGLMALLGAIRLWPLNLGALLVVLGAAGVFLRFILLIQTRANYRLGFSGERLVAEKLSPLVAEGCHVFHDFPADPKWNIDHIVVAPSGVYAIETKTRRKQKTLPGTEEHKAFYEGSKLRFPRGYDTADLNQAKANARWLTEYLTKTVGEPVIVTPMLTYPGWLVELTTRPDFPVLNPKQIPKIVLSRPATLDAQFRGRIAYQVELRCRDVEF
jgi:hypothetical protein